MFEMLHFLFEIQFFIWNRLLKQFQYSKSYQIPHNIFGSKCKHSNTRITTMNLFRSKSIILNILASKEKYRPYMEIHLQHTCDQTSEMFLLRVYTNRKGGLPVFKFSTHINDAIGTFTSSLPLCISLLTLLCAEAPVQQ